MSNSETRKKYFQVLKRACLFTADDTGSKELFNNARNTFACDSVESDSDILLDISDSANGEAGMLLTKDELFFRDLKGTGGRAKYSDITDITVIGSDKLLIQMNNGLRLYFSTDRLDMPKLSEQINDTFRGKTGHVESTRSDNIGGGALGSGYAAGAYGVVNKLYDEEKFHSRQGHGFAAERINTLYDKVTGHDAHIIGDDNAKNGADRIVDGTYIQSKYCATGSRCVNECFENDGKGNFRYLIDGKPMSIEVPSDKYDDAVRAMQEKIRRGQVPGVTDPEEAKKIIRKGHFTYEQAKRVAQAGTIESLSYDAFNGCVYAASAFGVSALITFATNVWNGEGIEKSLKLATYSGLRVGGTTFVTTILAGQLSKAGLNSAMVGASEAVISFIGPKASAVLVNAFRGSADKIYGAAAMKSAAKLLRGNVITAGATIVVMSSFDIVDIFRGRISGSQLFKNLTNTTASVAGGTGGWMAGAAIGSTILPGVGTVIGGLIGSLAGGAAASKVTNTVVGAFIEDDANKMVDIIREEYQRLAEEYLLNQKEAENVADRLKDILDGKKLKEMFASKDRCEFADELLIPLIEEEVAKREHIGLISDEDANKAIREVLEEIQEEIVSESVDSYSQEIEKITDLTTDRLYEIRNTLLEEGAGTRAVVGFISRIDSEILSRLCKNKSEASLPELYEMVEMIEKSDFSEDAAGIYIRELNFCIGNHLLIELEEKLKSTLGFQENADFNDLADELAKDPTPLFELLDYIADLKGRIPPDCIELSNGIDESLVYLYEIAAVFICREYQNGSDIDSERYKQRMRDYKISDAVCEKYDKILDSYEKDKAASDIEVKMTLIDCMGLDDLTELHSSIIRCIGKNNGREMLSQIEPLIVSKSCRGIGLLNNSSANAKAKEIAEKYGISEELTLSVISPLISPSLKYSLIQAVKKNMFSEINWRTETQITDQEYKNAVNTFAQGVARENIVYMYDNTVFNSGKSGAVITTEKVCIYNGLVSDKPNQIMFADIAEVKEEGKAILFKLKDGRFIKDIAFSTEDKYRKSFIEIIINIMKVFELTGFKPENVSVSASVRATPQCNLLSADNARRRIIAIAEQNRDKIMGIQIGDNIDRKILNAAISKYANGVNQDDVAALIDMSIMSNGKSGVLFTSDSVYFSSLPFKQAHFKYNDISSMTIKKGNPSNANLLISLYDGTVLEFIGLSINKQSIIDMINAVRITPDTL